MPTIASTQLLALADDVVVTVEDVGLCVRTSRRQEEAVQFSDLEVLRLMMDFKRPRSLASVVATTGSNATAMEAAVDQLVEIGVLRPWGEMADSPAFARSLADRVREIATGVHLLAGDAAVLDAHAEARPADSPARSLGVRLDALIVAVRSLLDACASARDELTTRHVAERTSNGGAPLRINIGSGQSRLDSWLNVDVQDADVCVNLRDGLPFDTASASHVYACHVLEHFYYPVEAAQLLGEIHRVLAPGGRVRIVVPDIEQCIRAYAADDREFFAARGRTWPWAASCRTKLDHFLAYAGASAHPSDVGGHKYGYDFDTLEHLMAHVGFSDIVRGSYMSSSDPILLVDDRSENAAATYRGEHYSLFVEGTR